MGTHYFVSLFFYYRAMHMHETRSAKRGIAICNGQVGM